MDSAKRNLRENQRESATWLSALFFWWTVSIFKNSHKKTLDADDLYEPLKCDRSDRLGNQLDRKWKLECKNSERPSLMRAVAKTFWKELLIMGIMCFINNVVISLVIPFLLGNILKYFRRDSDMAHQDALKYGIAMIALTLFMGVCSIHYFFNGRHYGLKVRIAVCSVIYKKVLDHCILQTCTNVQMRMNLFLSILTLLSIRAIYMKALRLSRVALSDTAPGKIVNLLSNDVNRFDAVMIVANSLWASPLMTIIAGYLLWREIQWSSIIGISIVFFFVPFQSYTGKLSSKFRYQTATRTDERIRFMDEIISGIQVIKLYAWERSFAKLITHIRRQELKIIIKNSYVRAMYMSLNLFTTRVALCCTVLSIFFIYGRENATVAKIFVVSALFNAISQGMGQTFILGITEIAEVLVAFHRLQAFLEYDEKQNKSNAVTSTINGNLDNLNLKNVAILMENVSARWIPMILSTDDNRSNDNPSYDNPSNDNPSNDNPSNDNPSNDNPSNDNPSYDNSSNDNPCYDNPSNDNPSYDNPSYDNSSNDNPSNDNPSNDNPSNDNPYYDNSSNDNPCYDNPSNDNPSYDNSSNDNPSNDNPSNDNPCYDNPYYDNSSNDNPSNDNPSNDNPYNDIPSNDNTFNDKMTLSQLTLQNVDVKIPKGHLIGVIGPVGAGKSSLLQVLLRELPLESGSINISGSISYASQDPWIFCATARQNILFDQTMDTNRYDAVVRCTALQKDFQQFKAGDLTMIGENGVSLSGGQKARISLARAVYRNADIYLLDDPLSAVDAHVGKHLFDKCIGPRGYLAHATRILITHQVHFLQEADWILVLCDGMVEIQGTYNDLLNSGVNFTSSLRKPNSIDSDRVPQPCELLNQGMTNTAQLIKSISMEEHTKDKAFVETNITSKGEPINITGKLNDESQLLQELESTSKGKVKGALLTNYFNAARQPIMLVIMLVLFLMAQVLASSADWWVHYWTGQEEIRNYYSERENLGENAKNESVVCVNHASNHNHSQHSAAICDNAETILNILPIHTYAYVYGGIIISLFVVAITRSISMFRICVNISQNVHDNMFQSLMATTIRFFNTNPSGRILNRFSIDMGIIDEYLPNKFLDAAQINLSMFGAVIITTIINPKFIVIIIIMAALFSYIRKIYVRTSTDIKRFEGITKSPIFTHISATLAGLPTIRACSAEEKLQQEFDNHQDLNTGASYMFIATGSAFALSLEFMAYIFILCVTTYFLLIDTDVSGVAVGLAITQSLTLSGFFRWGVRQSAEIANQLMSVERALEYSCLDVEKEPNIPIKLPQGWPSQGKIEFKNMFYRYYIKAEPVLRGLSFIIQSKEKIGIVGRTGAGKSSLIASLFRLAHIDGDIFIDDINTAQIELKDLRSKIAIIPQDPVLFSGTLRKNLDPFDEYSDADVWSALEHVEQKEIALGPLELNLKVMARGSNFSVGQRQLLCLARAILRKNSILVLDEATANVDPQTDLLIQKTIRTKFKDCTVLTVAHRLHTIIDSDRVLVMDAGIVIEFDTPYMLLGKSNGIFKGMVESLGAQEFDRLSAISQLPKY